VKDVPVPTNCVPFHAARAGRLGRARGRQPARETARPAERLTEIFDHLSPAQYAFLSGVLAILVAHGEDALRE
jgi:hypothetical protein